MVDAKDYIYISEAKVDLLYEQIESPDTQKTGAEYGVDVKLFKWMGKRESEKVITKVTKLNRVVEFITKSKKVGTIDEPATYFRGTLRMNWGPLEDELIFFTGQSSETLVALAGSSKHLIGGTVIPHTSLSDSLLPVMYEVFRKYTAKEINPPDYFGPDHRPVLGDKENSLAVIQSVARLFEGASQKVEFLAKNHLFGSSQGANVVLGTPFYVAVTE